MVYAQDLRRRQGAYGDGARERVGGHLQVVQVVPDRHRALHAHQHFFLVEPGPVALVVVVVVYLREAAFYGGQLGDRLYAFEQHGGVHLRVGGPPAEKHVSGEQAQQEGEEHRQQSGEHAGVRA